MEYRQLGRTGWGVSAVSCGTYRTFDGNGNGGEQNALELMRENLLQGVNLFDTAPMYGAAEHNLGQAGRYVIREHFRPFLIATKVLQSGLAGAKKQIRQSFEQLQQIDLLQIHNMAGWREVLPYLAELKQAGHIHATGITHYDPGAYGEMEEAMRTGQVDVIQIPYNVAERTAEQRILPLARELNLGVLVMTPIAPMFQRDVLLQKLRSVDLTPYRDYGVADHGALALKWVLSRAPEAVPIPATSRLERVRGNAAAGAAPNLPQDLLQKVEAAV